MKWKILLSVPLLIVTVAGAALLWFGNSTLNTDIIYIPFLLGTLVAIGIGILTGRHFSGQSVWLISLLTALIVYAVSETTRPIYVIHGLPLPNPGGLAMIGIAAGSAEVTARLLSSRVRDIFVIILTIITAWIVVPLAWLNTAFLPNLPPRSFTPEYSLSWNRTLETNAYNTTGYAAENAFFLTSPKGTLRLSLNSGEVEWHNNSGAIEPEPVLMMVDKTLCIVDGARATGFDARTGRTLWNRADLPDFRLVRPMGRNVLLLPENKSGAVRAWYALLDPVTGSIQEVDLPGPPEAVTLSGWMHDDYPGPHVVMAGNGTLALHINWGAEGTRPGFYAGSETPSQNYAHLYGLEKNGELSWHVQTGAWDAGSVDHMISWDSRTLAAIEPHSVTGGQGKVLVYTLPTGELLWDSDSVDNETLQVALSRELVMISRVNPETYNTYFIDAYQRDNGKQLWSVSTELPDNSPPSLFLRVGETLVFRNATGLIGYHANDGRPLWEWVLPGPDMYTPLYLHKQDKTIITLLPQYFSGSGAGYGSLIDIDAETGAEIPSNQEYWYSGEGNGVFSNSNAGNLVASPLSFLFLLQRYPVAACGGYPGYPNVTTTPDLSSLEPGRGVYWQLDHPLTQLPDGSIQLMPWRTIQNFADGKLIVARDKNDRLVMSFFERSVPK